MEAHQLRIGKKANVSTQETTIIEKISSFQFGFLLPHYYGAPATSSIGEKEVIFNKITIETRKGTASRIIERMHAL